MQVTAQPGWVEETGQEAEARCRGQGVGTRGKESEMIGSWTRETTARAGSRDLRQAAVTVAGSWDR